MSQFKRVVCLFLVLILAVQPITVLGMEKANAEKASHLKEAIQREGTPKKVKEASKDIKSVTKDDFPLVEPGKAAGSLIDSKNKYHHIWYKNILDYTDSKMSVDLYYESSAAYNKDPIISIEFYSEKNDAFEFLGYTEFNVNGTQYANLSSRIDKAPFMDQKYIYILLGVSKSVTAEYYTDAFLFKLKNPFYKAEEEGPSNKYAIISNESVIGESFQSTGQFSINNNKYTFNKKLKQDAFRLDVKKPFDVRKNKGKQLGSYKSKRSAYQLGQSKNFWVYDYSSYTDYQINATLLYSGSKANVWVNNSQLTQKQAEDLGKEFDTGIHPLITNHFAGESDVNGDGKINVLAYDIQDGFNGSGGYIAGYFYPGDLYNIPYSNQSEIFYVDTYPLMGTGGVKDPSASYETLAHEFQHMVNFNQNVFIEGDEEGMDIWLDEALAMAAEQVYTEKPLNDRIDYYNYSNSISKGHSLLYWDYDGDTLANYSLSYLFGQYVKLQANKGNDIFKEILKDSNNDYKAVENVMKKYVDPSLTFGKTMTNFRAALLLKKPEGQYGFNGEKVFDALQPRLYSGTSTSLRGGGAIVTQATANMSIPANKGEDITYTFVGEEEDTTPPSAPKVVPVRDYDKKVTGQAEAGSTVTVKKGSSILGKSAAGTDGKFSAALKASEKAGTVLTITATDKAGNVSKAVSITVLDKTAPAAPKADPVKDYDKKITGKAEAGSKVTVKKGSSTLGSAAADQNGKFTISLKSALKAGTILDIIAADKAGNVSKIAKVTVLDKTAPAAPKVNAIKDSDKKITGTAESGSKITVKKGNTILGTATAAKDRKFTVTIKSVQKADTVLYVTAKDKAGNISKAAKITVKDKTPPKTPSVNKVTSSSTKVTGKAEAYSTVYVKAGSKVIGSAKAAKSGSFSVKIAKQKTGKTLYVYAKDKAGNTGKSAKITVKKR
ncbi:MULTISPECIES: Ig-like domain-containing protein [unclassified Cytobacillus]|uniref:Ig-like domain-containing protein n=1 Tax=unclassified Cytobacillus TaxID=2675268 RepID=UPI0020403BBE|nr:Ig-like domain-containing protein [Cytobacillus sp. AMY 15.2]MCM3090650.1 Ig-like domain-containing protein [Cytobacillus sp. AMY 15.2]